MTFRIYVETSVISYLAARPNRDLIMAAHQEVTREWWQTQRQKFALFTPKANEPSIYSCLTSLTPLRNLLSRCGRRVPVRVNDLLKFKKHYKINSCSRSKYMDYQPKASSKHACKHLRRHARPHSVNHST
jgi:hypothetical protein